MNEQMKTSPMLTAVDLVRVSVDSMTLEELEAHAVSILDTIAALNDYINSSTFKGFNALRNAVGHSRKLATHMRRVRDLIGAQSAVVAMMAMPSTDAATQTHVMPRSSP